MSIDVSIIGIVFALILFIIIFSAVILYLAFRIKETFREEKRRGARVAKIAFLIGILFLAGGSFYFFANILTLPPSSPFNENGKPRLSLNLSYPSTVRMNTQITIGFTITNPTNYTAHDVTIQTNVLLEHFSLVSSTHEVLGNIIKIGDMQPGTTVSSLEVISPARPTNVQDNISLTFKEMEQPLTEDLLISVYGGQ